ncbi:MAG: hypothetical protein A2Y72_04055 [Chloroflexi bacterium RBG_13_53_26]|nr:MAG: hypothetical protein A2Y72_04055 [Chloroflexi bacterium RBG_13_53_26]
MQEVKIVEFLSLLVMVPSVLTVVVLIYLVTRGLPERGNEFSAQHALIAYSYTLIALSVIAGAVGLVYFVRIGIMEAYELDWAYNDVILASVLTGTGMVLSVLHLLTKNTVKSGAEQVAATAKRQYLSWMVFGFGITTLVLVPLAIYQAIQYYRDEIYTAPATEISVAVVIAVVWTYYLLRIFREV